VVQGSGFQTAHCFEPGTQNSFAKRVETYFLGLAELLHPSTPVHRQHHGHEAHHFGRINSHFHHQLFAAFEMRFGNGVLVEKRNRHQMVGTKEVARTA
jgi:hypothetical protein